MTIKQNDPECKEREQAPDVCGVNNDCSEEYRKNNDNVLYNEFHTLHPDYLTLIDTSTLPSETSARSLAPYPLLRRPAQSALQMFFERTDRKALGCGLAANTVAAISPKQSSSSSSTFSDIGKFRRRPPPFFGSVRTLTHRIRITLLDIDLDVYHGVVLFIPGTHVHDSRIVERAAEQFVDNFTDIDLRQVYAPALIFSLASFGTKDEILPAISPTAERSLMGYSRSR